MSRGRIAIAALALLASAVILFEVLRSGADESETVTDVAVHVGAISRATLHRYVTAYGTVEAAPAAAGRAAAGAVISPLVEGVLVGIDAVEGAPVGRGAVLFRLDSRMAEVAVRKARQDLAFAEQALDRQRALLEIDGTSQRAFQEAQLRFDAARADFESAGTALDYLRIASPLAGTLVRIDVRVGQSVSPGTVLGEVVDLDRLVVTAGVPSGEAGGLAVGQPVRIGEPADSLTGGLTVLGRDVDPTTGTYRVQASIPAGAGLMPGEFTEIRILAEEHADVLVVPEESLVTRADSGSWIMVVEGEQAVRTPVTVGLREGGLAEVSGPGLAEGTAIVTEEAYSLPAETKIHAVGS